MTSAVKHFFVSGDKGLHASAETFPAGDSPLDREFMTPEKIAALHKVITQAQLMAMNLSYESVAGVTSLTKSISGLKQALAGTQATAVRAAAVDLRNDLKVLTLGNPDNQQLALALFALNGLVPAKTEHGKVLRSAVARQSPEPTSNVIPFYDHAAQVGRANEILTVSAATATSEKTISTPVAGRNSFTATLIETAALVVPPDVKPPVQLQNVTPAIMQEIRISHEATATPAVNIAVADGNSFATTLGEVAAVAPVDVRPSTSGYEALATATPADAGQVQSAPPAAMSEAGTLYEAPVVPAARQDMMAQQDIRLTDNAPTMGTPVEHLAAVPAAVAETKVIEVKPQAAEIAPVPAAVAVAPPAPIVINDDMVTKPAQADVAQSAKITEALPPVMTIANPSALPMAAADVAPVVVPLMLAAPTDASQQIVTPLLPVAPIALVPVETLPVAGSNNGAPPSVYAGGQSGEALIAGQAQTPPSTPQPSDSNPTSPRFENPIVPHPRGEEADLWAEKITDHKSTQEDRSEKQERQFDDHEDNNRRSFANDAPITLRTAEAETAKISQPVVHEPTTIFWFQSPVDTAKEVTKEFAAAAKGACAGCGGGNCAACTRPAAAISIDAKSAESRLDFL